MAAIEVERKLVAILNADVQGYSRLMGDDEESTVETITAYRKVFSNYIAQYRGRVVNSPGDSILAEFPSVVDAVNAAVEIQRELAERNAELPDEYRMAFRIGVNLCDVIVKDDVIYGDGVNIAARVQSLADGAGICISGSAYAQVRNKLKLAYEFLGKKEVKNIAEPVPVYRVLSVPGAAAHRVIEAKIAVGRKWRTTALVMAVGVVVVVGLVAAGYYWRSGSSREDGPSREAAGLPLPEKPSIAVLAFDNLSGDPQQEYFSDGMSENIIIQLAKLPSLFVIARNSSFTYKGRPVKVQRVAEELGVRYVLEGGIQKAGNRIRITAQLVDALTGRHLWAERYDRELKDLFAVQDEITLKVVGEIVKQLELKLPREEVAQVKHDTTENVQAWDYYAQGMDNYRKFDSYHNAQARKLFHKALDLEPEFAAAILGVGWTYYAQARWKWGVAGDVQTMARDEAAFFDRASEMAKRVIAVDDKQAEPYALLGQVHLGKRQYDQAIAYGRRAVALNPNGADFYVYLANTLSYAGKPEEALTEWNKALRFNPSQPRLFPEIYGRILYQLARYEEAIEILDESFREDPLRWNRYHSAEGALLIASYSALDRPEAKQLAAEYYGSPSHLLRNKFLFKEQSDVQRILDDLARVGLK